jgi:hypothetical protein
MSAAARWSLTARATCWALQSRGDWNGALTFAAPVSFDCDYNTTSMRRRSANGDEFSTKLVLYTEKADIALGDRIILGNNTAADPIAAGALEVRSVIRHADVFDRAADDFEVSA